MAEPWMRRAACTGLTALFFPARGDIAGVQRARAICDGCPVRSPCLDWAMTPDAPRDGVLAGLTGRERKQLRRDTDRVPAPLRARRPVMVPPLPRITVGSAELMPPTRAALLEARG